MIDISVLSREQKASRAQVKSSLGLLFHVLRSNNTIKRSTQIRQLFLENRFFFSAQFSVIETLQLWVFKISEYYTDSLVSYTAQGLNNSEHIQISMYIVLRRQINEHREFKCTY